MRKFGRAIYVIGIRRTTYVRKVVTMKKKIFNKHPKTTKKRASWKYI